MGSVILCFFQKHSLFKGLSLLGRNWYRLAPPQGKNNLESFIGVMILMIQISWKVVSVIFPVWYFALLSEI